MPKIDMDYSKTIIYKLVCNDLNIIDVYVGHTTNFIKRKAKHKKACNNINDIAYNRKVYQIIRENGGFENWTMVEIEKYPCNDKNEACARERYYYELLNAKLNTVCPYRVDKKEISKATREKNKDKIKQRKSKVSMCECGCEYTEGHKARHLRTQKHKQLLEQNN